MSIFAGLDVSDKTTHLCVVDADGVVLKRDVVASDPAVLAKRFGKHCSGLPRAVLETGPLSTLMNWSDAVPRWNVGVPATLFRSTPPRGRRQLYMYDNEKER